MSESFFYEAAMAALARGRSVIPLEPCRKEPYFDLLPRGAGGKPAWRPYATRRPTPDEVARWSEQSQNKANLGVLMGHVSGVTGFDIDFRHDGHKTWHRLAGDKEVLTETVESADGLHFYFRDPGFRFHLREPLPGIDLRTDGGYLVYPPSVHPTGVLYRHLRDVPPLPLPPWLSELIVAVDDATPALELPNSGTLTRAECRAAFARFPRAKYRSRSEYDMAVITHLANRGIHFDLLRAVFGQSQGTHYQRLLQERGLKAADSNLKRSYEKARRLPRIGAGLLGEHAEAAQRAQQMRQAVNERVWPGASGPSDRAVLLAHIKKFERCGVEPYNLSVREIAESASVCIDTASRSNRRLLGAQYLRVVSEGRWPIASAYELGPRLQDRLQEMEQHTPREPRQENNILTNVSICPFIEHSGTAEHVARAEDIATFGVFERQVLGKTAELIWSVLWHQSLTQREVCQKTGRSKGSVSETLKKLTGIGMVKKTANVYTANLDFDFAGYAKQHGTEAIPRVRAVVHEEQRYRNHRNSMLHLRRAAIHQPRTRQQPRTR